jgi:hypothetical protein
MREHIKECQEKTANFRAHPRGIIKIRLSDTYYRKTAYLLGITKFRLSESIAKTRRLRGIIKVRLSDTSASVERASNLKHFYRFRRRPPPPFGASLPSKKSVSISLAYFGQNVFADCLPPPLVERDAVQLAARRSRTANRFNFFDSVFYTHRIFL